MVDGPAEWPFAIREDVLARLTGIVLDGAGHAVLLGPHGAGRTRLARELIRTATASGIPARLLTATPGAHCAMYDAIRDAIGVSASADDAPIGAGRPVLVIDDAHHLDDASAAILLSVAQAGTARVVLTVAAGADPAAAVKAMWRDDVARRLDLPAPTSAEIVRLLAAGLGGDLDAVAGTLIAEWSGGDLVRLRDVVRAGLQSGALAEVDGVWRWDGPLDVTPRLADIVGGATADLGRDEREALALLAVTGPLSPPVARTLVDGPVLTALEEAAVVALDDDGGVRVDPLCGEVIRQQTGPLRRDEYLRRVVAAWGTATALRPDERLRSTTWSLDLGVPVSSTALVDAAALAEEGYDFELADRLAGDVLQQHEVPADDRNSALLTIARAKVATNEFEAAETLLDQSEQQLLAGPRPTRLAYLDVRHDALYMGLFEREPTLAMLDRFEAAQPDDDEWARTCAAPLRSEVLMGEGRLHEAIALNAPVLSAARPGPLALLPALETTGEAQIYLGRTDSVRTTHARLAKLAATGPPEVARGAAYTVLQTAMCRWAEGRLTESIELAAGLHASAGVVGDPHQRGLVALCLGGFQLHAGLAVSARRVLLDALDGLRRRDSGHALYWVHVMLARAELLLGDPAAARRRWAQAEERRAPRIARMVEDIAMTEAWLRVAEGDATGAITTLVDAQATIPELIVPRIRLLHLAGILDGGPRLRGELAGLVAQADPPHLSVYGDHLEALAGDDGPGLARVAVRFEEAGQLLRAQEAWTHAAEAHQRRGLPGPALLAQRRASALAERSEGARSPLLAAVSVQLPALSRRESEVAHLVAAGLSNSEVADRLTLSVRTVESHVYRVFGKLGVGDRAELSELFG